MSDYDRSRRRKKRVGYGGSGRDRDDDGLIGTMVILAKPPSENPSQAQSSASALSDPVGSSNSTVDNKLLTLLSKGDSKNSSTGTTYSEQGASNTTYQLHVQQKQALGGATYSDTTGTHAVGNNPPIYQLQQKPITQNLVDVSSIEQKLLTSEEMLAPVKLLDEALGWCENAMEYLQEQNDFYVIGVVGLQGVGKSTVLSLLSGQYTHGRQIFKAQTEELGELGAHCTSGIDIYVTNERLILLDTQPVLSASVMDRIIQYEKKNVNGPEYKSTENALQMQSLQITSFLLAVCHTIILVQDWFLDANLIRFVLSAEMLKPSTSSNSQEMGGLIEDMPEHFPNLVFVQNKCHQSDFSRYSLEDMENTLKKMFVKSRMKHQGFISMDSKSTNNGTGSKVNLFLLPEKDGPVEPDGSFTVPEYKGHPGFKELGQTFAHQILSMPLTLLTRRLLSEKNWFHYAARIWEAVKKSNLFLEYNRLLP